MSRTLSNKPCEDLRAKFRAQRLLRQLVHAIEEIYPPCPQVYERAQFRLELLTKEYLCRVGRTMLDKTRFFHLASAWARRPLQPVHGLGG
jgi:hypothetical protein